MSQEWQRKMEEARARLPLRRLMEQYSCGPENGNWKSFPKCPGCGKKGSSSVFVSKANGIELFKCFNAKHGCPFVTAVDEAGFLRWKLSLSNRDACVVWFKESGVWADREKHAPSIMPGKAARKIPQPGLAGEPPALKVDAEGEGDDEVPLEVLEAGAEGVIDNLPAGTESSDAPGRELETVLPNGKSLAPVVESGSSTVPAQAQALRAEPVLPPEADPSPAPAEEFNLAAAAATAVPVVAVSTETSPPAPTNLTSEVRTLEIATLPDYSEGKARPTIQIDERPASWARIMNGEPAAPAAVGGGGGEPPEGGLPPGEGEEDDGDEPEREEGEGSPSLKALRYFYAKLTLTAEDEAMLWRKRGLTPETCRRFGLVSGVPANKEILVGMVQTQVDGERGDAALNEKWPLPVLVDAGLFTRDARKLGGDAKPNAQLCGWGLIGKKKKAAGVREDEEEWGWTNPVLIPYFDSTGEVVALRPHKGGTSGKAARLFVVRARKGMEEKPRRTYVSDTESEPVAGADVAIMSEGEFKGMALWQGLQGWKYKLAIATLPGIQMSKPMAGDIEDWLDAAVSPGRRVVVAFDAEEKGNPSLPGYNDDPKKRHDAQIWARYLAKEVTKEGYEGRVCVLPNNWRDAKGKADWDGALAMLIARESRAISSGDPIPADWAKVSKVIRNEFVAVLESALAVHELWSFFDNDVEKIIQNGLLQIGYVPKLPVGGHAEEATSKRLMRLNRRLRDSGGMGQKKEAGRHLNYLKFLAKKYEDLNGKYYTFKRLSEGKAEEWHNVQLEADEEMVDLRRACETVLLGIPEPVSDFFLKCHYELRKLDGKRDRLVTLQNIHGRKTPMLALPSAPFAQPSKWREWLLDAGGFTWLAGEQALQALQADLARATARLEVVQMAVRGWHAEAKLWFYKDVAFTLDGEEVKPDKHGIIWYHGEGYKPSESDHEGEEFCQGEPQMWPLRKLAPEKGKEEAKAPTEEEAVRELFVGMSQKMNETLGGFEGYMALGIIMACGAGPAIYQAYTAFPGLWVHGEASQGKSSFVKWLLRVWGFRRDTGLKLSESTKVGVAIALQQYGNLPVWLEEIQSDTPKWMVDMIKASYNRESGNKKTFGERRRRIIASCIVSGVATAPDAQVRSRFAHVLVSAQNRKANHFEWFEERSPEFYAIGRYIMRHQKEYRRLVMEAMTGWMNSPDMQGTDARARLVHGVAYAGFYAMVALLQSHDAPSMRDYRKFLVKHTAAQVSEVARTMDANQFFEDILSALEKDAFGRTPSERQRLFKVVNNPRPRMELPQFQIDAAKEQESKRWEHKLLYFQPDPVINALKEYKRRMGEDMAISRTDLLSQMKTHGYWVQPWGSREGKTHIQKFGGVNRSCWCIDMDFHPMGYQAAGSEAWEESLRSDAQPSGYMLARDWTDPRKGDLFGLVASLKGQTEEQT